MGSLSVVALSHALTRSLGGAAPSMLFVAVVFFPQLDGLVRALLPAVAAHGADAPGVILRALQLVWLYIGHMRYELPCLFADTAGQVLHFFPKGFYEEIEPYTREARERRNDAVLLRLQRTKTEAEKMRVAEIHPEVFRRLIARVERWQWRHARTSFVDNLITSDDGRKARRRFAFLSRSVIDVLRKRLAEAEAHWEPAPADEVDERRADAPARAARAGAAASARARARTGKVALAKPRAARMERPKKRK